MEEGAEMPDNNKVGYQVDATKVLSIYQTRMAQMAERIHQLEMELILLQAAFDQSIIEKDHLQGLLDKSAKEIANA